MSEFVSKPGCPMCGISTSRLNSTPQSSPKNILWRDENFTAYREEAHPVSSQGHIVVAFNLHIPSLYKLEYSDLPLLVGIKDLSIHLLSSVIPTGTPVTLSSTSSDTQRNKAFRVGFITPPFKDVKIPVTDHLHAHAFIGDLDLAGWLRRIAYSSVAWYDIDDLMAEIRETVSNNRVKSGHQYRPPDPTEQVPGAGATKGRAGDSVTTQAGISDPHPV